ncbi:OmpA family protein [Sulfitobacter sabulilitoris]|uniref:OmpA family protein n=1 Tax=Sulfitobacter sabulilitoris TaxID=2562655 RepID=A0A5S3QB87_9RHOB|nr:OmpA family protein [Sulfitobacter sabulilitoris]TMM54362.1 OmpA family protein [Sulfitobacter sabulilitoris]
MKSILNATTALTVCVSISMPATGFAQEGAGQCQFTEELPTVPCVLGDGQVIGSIEEWMTAKAGGAEAQAAAQAQQEAEAQAAADAQAQQEAEAQAAADAQAQQEAEAQAAADAQAQQEAEAQAAADAQAQQEAEAQAAADAQAQQEAEAQAAADAQAQQEAEAQAAADAQAQQEAEAQAAADAQAQQEAEAQAAADAQAQQEAEAQAAADADAAKDERKAARKAERQAARQAEREAAAAAAAAADSSGADNVEVTTEEVAEEDVRTSNQEFSTDVTGNAPSASAESDDSGGLSKFEKALLLGLGAVAVGTVLKNGDQVMSRSGDRVVVERDGELRVLKDDDALLRQPGNEVRTETFNDGSTRSTVTREDGSQIVTIRGRDGTVLSRTRIGTDGEATVLFDDTVAAQEVVVSELPQVEEQSFAASDQSENALRAALAAELNRDNTRRFSLNQVRDIRQVRALAPEIELDAIRFETGSAAIQPEQARALAEIGGAIREMIAEDPRTVILVEGHTDAVGSATYNLALSDRRAETVALALTEYFDVPPENLITQGYGEGSLRIQTEEAEQLNRRAVVRNITALLR